MKRFVNLKLHAMKVLLLLNAVFLLNVSCSTGQKKQWEMEKDSIVNVNQQQRDVLDDMTSTIVEIATSLDSISSQEQLLTSRYDSEGKALSKKKILENLAFFENLLTEKREEMKLLQASLSNKGEEIKKMGKIIQFLNEELDKKDVKIQQLKAEVADKNYNIKLLSGQVASLNDSLIGLSDSISDLHHEASAQKQTLLAKEKELNKMYYIIGTKKELMNKGIISSKGFLSKSTINYNFLDYSSFTEVDKRTCKIIHINGGSPKILSNNPSSSYELEDSKKGPNTLAILNADKFWSSGKFLVIQINK